MTNYLLNAILSIMEGKTQEPRVQPQQPIISPKILKHFTKKILIIFIIVFILITLGATAFYFLKFKSSKKEPNPIACTQEAKLCPDGSAVGRTGPNCEFTPCPSSTNKGDASIQAQTADWKKYINKKYGFELTYPGKGVIQGEKNQYEGECGKEIKENAEGIFVDNFFQIKILDWKGSINDYIEQKGAKGKYELGEIADSNADEAIEVISIKKGLELSSVGYPPLMYVSGIYKKGNNLFIMIHQAHPPEPMNPNGCLNPKDLDYTKYPKYANQAWDITKSIKFLPKPN